MIVGRIKREGSRFFGRDKRLKDKIVNYDRLLMINKIICENLSKKNFVPFLASLRLCVKLLNNFCERNFPGRKKEIKFY